MERSSRPFRAPVAVIVPFALALALMAASCSSGTTTAISPGNATPGATVSPPSSGQSPVPSQKPVPTESNPPGDIPDNTVFVQYTAKAGGFSIKVPEGWARKNTSSSVTFTSALNSIGASWLSASTAPTVSSARSNDVPALQQSELAFALQSVKAVSLPGGSAVLITFQENSTPNAVTGKQYRMDVLRFELFKGGTEAVLTLTSPVGADNVDPWRTVSESFRWS